VLGYHAISSSWSSILAASPTHLEEQLLDVRSRGYVGLTVTDTEIARRDHTLPPRTVVVTFDDGYASTLLAARSSRRSDSRAQYSSSPRSWRPASRWTVRSNAHWRRPETLEELRSMTWSDAEALVERGWEVGSHTVSRPLQPKSDNEVLRSELSESRAEIEKQLGSCTSIAYPFGLADERVAEEARRVGYDVAYMLTLAQIADEPMRRPRVGMAPGDHGTRLKLQLSDPRARRSPLAVARLARKLRLRRSWLPDE
jgi:peptidoglycan/xylan/chitin deacetylase (PgdA/CDA1 family)